MKSRRLLAFLVLLGTLTIVSPPVTQASQQAAPPQPTPQTQTTTQSAEVAALRAQLETTRFYDNRLVETVYWGLTTVVGLMLVITGLGWYTNFRLYKRDKEALQSDLRSMVQSEVRSAFAEIERELSPKVKTAVADVTAAHDKRITDLKEDVLVIELHYRMHIVESRLAQGQRVAALRELVSGTKFAVDSAAGPFFVAKYLEKIVAILESGPVDAETTTLLDLENALAAAPIDCSTLVIKTRKLLAKDAG